MTEPLALKYRPKIFSEIEGQKINAVVLDRMVSAGEVPSGILFSGPRGSGKTSMARILASSLNASDLIEVDAASNGLVADVRGMIETLRYSTGGEYRVVIYDEAHSLTREAFNALLKTLEEPPSRTIFILVTTEPDKIPETVKSRLMEFTFRKIAPGTIMSKLSSVSEAEGIEVDNTLLTYISHRADGSLRDALMMLDQCWRASITDKETFLDMVGEEDVAPELVKAMMSGDHSNVFEVTDRLSERVPDPARIASTLVETLKNVLIIRAGGSGASLREDQKESIRTLALYLEPERIIAALRMLWDLRTRIRSSSDPRANLDLALVLITDIFSKGRTPPPAASQTPVQSASAQEPEKSRRMDFSEL